jgi:serine/tyrosine/threonine adenylyltransferase
LIQIPHITRFGAQIVPFDDHYRPDPLHPILGDAFYDPVAAADFPKSIIRFRNQRWADRLGLGRLTPGEWTSHFAQFAPLPDNIPEPLALRYHGHQFTSYNPDLGDGRGFLHAQLRDAQDNRLLDLATKGSGQTPWSRRGDGRLTLKGGLREVLATEMLEALGVYTSKSFSLIETGEELMRGDEPSPTRSSVLVRLGHSHVRFGTFQRLAHLGDTVNLSKLVDYAIAQYWPDAANASDPVVAFFNRVVSAMADLAAEWFAAGFVHGVLNTDNMVITGESFDYGPWRFLPQLDPRFTAAYFDETGLYAFGRQPAAVLWNLERLAECLYHLSGQQGFVAALESYPAKLDRALHRSVLSRLGLDWQHAPEGTLALFYTALRDSRAGYAQTYFDLIGGADSTRIAASPQAAIYASPVWEGALAALRAAPPHPQLSGAMAQPYFNGKAPCDMLIDEVEAIWLGIDRSDDWSAFETKLIAIRTMGMAHAPLMPVRNGHVPIQAEEFIQATAPAA